jgi:DNA repair exonuclease SbcCD ATPase subunit
MRFSSEFGAKILPAPCRFPSRFLVLALLLGVGACVQPRENPVRRVEQQQQLDNLSAQQDDLAQKRRRLELALIDDRAALQRMQDEVAKASSRRRDATAEAKRQAQLLKAAEQDLAAVQARLQQASKDLAGAVAQEQQLKDLAQRSGELTAKVAVAEQALAQQQKDIDAKLAELQQRATAVQSVAAAVQAAVTAAQQAGVLPPAAAPAAPAAAPAPAAPAPAPAAGSKK